VEEYREPSLKVESKIQVTTEVVDTSKKIKKRRITKKLERVKKGWMNSKQLVRKTANAIRDTFSGKAEFELDSADEQENEVVPETAPQTRFDVPAPDFLNLEVPKSATSKTHQKDQDRLDVPMNPGSSMVAKGATNSLNSIKEAPRDEDEGDVPSKCRFCPRTVGDAVDQHRHVQKNHPEQLPEDGSQDPEDDRRFSCPICPLGIMGEYPWRRHLTKEHAEELNRSV
jgi:hypothetical protein